MQNWAKHIPTNQQTVAHNCCSETHQQDGQVAVAAVGVAEGGTGGVVAADGRRCGDTHSGRVQRLPHCRLAVGGRVGPGAVGVLFARPPLLHPFMSFAGWGDGSVGEEGQAGGM